MEFLFHESGWPALLLLLCVSSIFILILPFVILQELFDRPSRAAIYFGFFLFAILLILGAVTTLLDLTIPGRDQLFFALLILFGGFILIGFSLDTMHDLDLATRTQRGLKLLALLGIFVLFSGFLRLIDWIRQPAAQRPPPLATALVLESWELPAYALFCSLILIVFAYIISRASVEPFSRTVDDQQYEASFAGPTPGIRKISRFVTVIFCLGLALYGLSYFSDALFNTAFTAYFQPIIEIGTTYSAVYEAWEYYAEWAGFIIVVAALAIYAVTENDWGCLALLIIGVAIYILVASYFGWFDDWQGPFRAAWQSVTSLFQ